MNCAIIENEVVVNVIVGPIPDGIDGVQLGDRPVAIGDSYANGVFTRDGVAVLTSTEKIAELEAENAEYDAALTEIETALGVNA